VVFSNKVSFISLPNFNWIFSYCGYFLSFEVLYTHYIICCKTFSNLNLVNGCAWHREALECNLFLAHFWWCLLNVPVKQLSGSGVAQDENASLWSFYIWVEICVLDMHPRTSIPSSCFMALPRLSSMHWIDFKSNKCSSCPSVSDGRMGNCLDSPKPDKTSHARLVPAARNVFRQPAFPHFHRNRYLNAKSLLRALLDWYLHATHVLSSCFTALITKAEFDALKCSLIPSILRVISAHLVPWKDEELAGLTEDGQGIRRWRKCRVALRFICHARVAQKHGRRCTYFSNAKSNRFARKLGLKILKICISSLTVANYFHVVYMLFELVICKVLHCMWQTCCGFTVIPL
jgi:hypothetical protein